MVKTPCFQCRGEGFNPWLVKQIPHLHGRKKKKVGEMRIREGRWLIQGGTASQRNPKICREGMETQM